MSRPTADRILPMQRAALLLVLVFVIGTVGFKIIGGSDVDLIDALFMTAITLTTVGYGETIEVSHSTGSEVFTVALLLMGVSSFLYFFSNVTAYIVEGTLDRALWRRRMEKLIKNMEDHYIVCGAGHTGRHIVRELTMTGRPFVVVEEDDEVVKTLVEELDEDFPRIMADATADETLMHAGIERAKGVFACVGSDKDNLIITFSARLLGDEALRIVCRCIDYKSMNKLRKAGANAVVSPNAIGGLRLVSEMVRPVAVEYLDMMLHDQERQLRVEDVIVTRDSKLVGKPVSSVHAHQPHDVMLVAIRRPDGTWVYNPSEEETLEQGDALVFIGSPEARIALEELAGLDH